MKFISEPHIHVRIPVPPGAREYLSVNIECDISYEEAEAIAAAIRAFDEEIRYNRPPVYAPLASLLVVIDNGRLCMDFSDVSNDMGNAMRLIVLHIDRWRSACRYDPRLIYRYGLIATLEELCHIHYQIDDEILVTRRVFACYRRLYPHTKYEELFDPNWQP